VSVNLVGLASSTASHKLANKGGQTRPPVVVLNQVNGAEISAMASHRGAVQGAYQILSSWFWDIKAALEVQGALNKCSVVKRRTREEGGMFGHSVLSVLNQWIGHSEVSNLLGQPHIQSTYQNIRDHGQQGNSSVVKRGVNLVTARQHIGWTHLRTRTVVPHKVMVLHEHRPSSLLSGEVLRRLEVCQVPMVSDNGDRVFRASEILVPLLE